MNQNQFMIETHDLTKNYGKAAKNKCVVNRLNLAVPEGCIYGFLGPNGAGKSTTMKMLLGLIKPSGGEVSLFGTPLFSGSAQTYGERDRLKILKQTGSLIESPSYYAHLTGRENLEIICALKQVPAREINEVLSIVRMEDQQDKKAGHYSLGMKQRLGLAGALLGHPRLLLLDEPTNGLDPAGISEMRDLIRSLPQKYHTTVMVSSHLLSEIDQMADYVGIINHGTLIYQDSLIRLHHYSRAQLKLRTTNNTQALRILNENNIGCSIREDHLLFSVPEDEKTAFLISTLVREGIGVLRVEEYQKSLEEIFLSLTGKQVSL